MLRSGWLSTPSEPAPSTAVQHEGTEQGDLWQMLGVALAISREYRKRAGTIADCIQAIEIFNLPDRCPVHRSGALRSLLSGRL